ncbi:hypothetical protein vseg_012470 [Gypsophila vaccaria]
MGNAALCAPAINSSNWAAKVLTWDGSLEVHTKAVKAAELMLENPGQFVCHAGTLQVGRRIEGLLADEELQCRQLYFLLPMEMLYSVLTQEEVSHLNYNAYKAMKSGSFHSLGKICPVFGDSCLFPSETKKSESDRKTQITEPQTCHNVSRQRSWRPALATIVEAS